MSRTRASEVQVGDVWSAKVGGAIVPVRVDEVVRRGGRRMFRVARADTGRPLKKLRGAQSFRELVRRGDPVPPPPPAQPTAPAAREKLPPARTTTRSGEPIPLYDLPTSAYASITYQERRPYAGGTPKPLQLPSDLLVSDLGVWPIPMEAPRGSYPGLPPEARFYQVVDIHMGYQHGFDRLLRLPGFGAAREWHYDALNQPRAFFDGEGKQVQRLIRLLRREKDGDRRWLAWTGPGEWELAERWGNPRGSMKKRKNSRGDAARREVERQAASGDPVAARKLARTRERSGPRCTLCGDPATHIWDEENGGDGDPYCWRCLSSNMEHGHRHVHDEPDDCVLSATRVDGSGVDTYICPVPAGSRSRSPLAQDITAWALGLTDQQPLGFNVDGDRIFWAGEMLSEALREGAITEDELEDAVDAIRAGMTYDEWTWQPGDPEPNPPHGPARRLYKAKSRERRGMQRAAAIEHVMMGRGRWAGWHPDMGLALLPGSALPGRGGFGEGDPAARAWIERAAAHEAARGKKKKRGNPRKDGKAAARAFWGRLSRRERDELADDAVLGMDLSPWLEDYSPTPEFRRELRRLVDAWIMDNPALAIINPGSKAKRRPNPGGKKKRKPTLPKKATLEAARAANPKAFREAVKRYKRFHGVEPDRALVVRVPGKGKAGVVAELGRVPETHYFTNDKESNKAEAHWVHKHLDGKEPIEVLDPETGLTFKIPTDGRTRITDWWHD